MLWPIQRIALSIVVPLVAALGQTPSRPLQGNATYNQDFCSSNAACYTPARGSQCPQVRFGWGNCPGSRQACDWCYGPNGVFAYAPRGSTYTLSSGCNQLGSNATWSTQDPQVAQWMSTAGGNCTADGRGGYACSNVDPAQFKQAANCGGSGNQPPAQQPAPSRQQPAQSSNSTSGNCSCYTPARGPQCPQVRFGWGDCPGSRQACDWCYGPNGVFAYSPRGSTYTLASGCNQLGSNTIWSTQDPQVAQSMTNGGGKCAADGQGGYSCSNVDPAKYQQTASCGNPGCATPSPSSGSAAAPISGTLPPAADGAISQNPQAACVKPQFNYFYINGVNTPMTNSNWRGNYVSEYGTVGINLVRDPKVPQPSQPFQPVPGSITVANEVDQMYDYTHNPSGTDPWNDDWYQQNCQPTKLSNAVKCAALKLVNDLRAGSATHGFSVGDMYECFVQAVTGFNYNDMVLKDETATKVIQAILNGYYGQSGQVASQSYFIIVAHSQGNFFAEAIAKYFHDNRQDIFNRHLGIVALASPTNYASVGDQNFLSTKVVHHTRADDAINVVATFAQLFGAVGLTGKTPFTSNDPPLWDWPSGLPAVVGIRPGLLPSHNPQPRPDLFSADQLVTCSIGLKGLQCAPGRFFQRLGYDSGVPANQNPELYSPLLNSHLLDDYLDTPPATKAGTPIKFQWGLVPWITAPQATSVLPCVRRDLMALKKNLMNGSTNPGAPMTKFDNAVCTGN